MTTHPAHTPAPADVVLPGRDAADLADLLGCLRDWVDAEHAQLDPLLASHGYDITGLRVALDRHTVLLTGNDDQPDF